MNRATVGLCGAAVLTLAPSAFAQDCIGDPLWSEDFDGMTAGGLIVFEQDCFPICSNGFSWQAWDFDAGVGNSEASDLFSVSAPNSGQISGNDGAGGTTDDLVFTYNDLDFSGGGTYLFSTQTYCPDDMTGESFFILLNTYIGGDPNKNWSTQVLLDADNNEVESDFDAGTVPLTKGEWRELKTIISLDDDLQTILYETADGVFSVVNAGAKTWTGGVSGGGILDIQALDLWGNTAPNQNSPMYYDDMFLCAIPPQGACCFREDACVEGVIRSECEALLGKIGGDPGVFQGIGSACGNCPFYGPNGWEIDALVTSAPPFVWNGDSCNDFPGIPFNEDCEFFPEDCSECDLDADSQDQAWSFEIPWTGTWSFSTCGRADFDTVLFTSFVGTCDDSGPFNDDCTDLIQGEDDSQVSVDIQNIGPHGDIYVTMEGFAGECGMYSLLVGSGCPDDPTIGPDEELLGPCEDEDTDTENVGCNAAAPAVPTFSPIDCGDTFSGTVGNFIFQAAGRRDLDWFELEITETSTVTMTARANYPQLVIFLADLNPNPGAGEDECTDAGNIITSDTTTTCVDESGNDAIASYSISVGPGLYSPIVSTAFVDPALPVELGGVPCGSGYEFEITCGATCEPNPCPDLDGSGFVDFGDILNILANWGNAGGAQDVDCSGFVDFGDILAVLANWGNPCP